MVTRATHPYNRSMSNERLLYTLKHVDMEPATRKDRIKEVKFRKANGTMRKSAKIGSKLR